VDNVNTNVSAKFRCTALHIKKVLGIFGPLDGVATNLENLEYSGISLNMENSGNSRGIMCNLREKLSQSIFGLPFNYLCKTAVDFVNRIIKNRDEVRVRW